MTRERIEMNTKRIKNGFATAWTYVRKGAAWLTPIIIAGVVAYPKNEGSVEMRYIGKLDYSDAIDAISKSTMYSLDKTKAIKLVKRDEKPEYYGAIASIVGSKMYSIDKVRSIEELNVE